MKKLIVILLSITIIILAFRYFQINNRSMDSTLLIGEWFSYQDCPTMIYAFSEDKNLRVTSCDGEYQTTSDQTVTYEIVGSKAEAIIDNEKYEFTFEMVEQEQKLKVSKGANSQLLIKKQQE